MNVREGMRRLGIVLGALGCIAGTVAGYRGWQALSKARAAHHRFEKLVALPTMTPVAKAARDYQKDWFAQNSPQRPVGPIDYQALAKLPRGYKLDKPSVKGDVFDQVEAEELSKTGSMRILVELDGVKEVTADKTGAISSLTLLTGETIKRVGQPSFLKYVTVLCFPVIGFLVPWGLLWVFTWIGTGFFSK